MDLITKYDGAVFFVDILGMGALTKNEINLKKEDMLWLKKHKFKLDSQYLAASILGEFRKILLELKKEFANVTFSQLSDCAFIWSKDISEVIVIACKFMNNAINNGLLCRGGLTYGEIIETNNEHELGRFIVGKAVTEAVKLEGLAKGARVLIDENFPAALWELNSEFADSIVPLFAPFTNPLDYLIYDEFKWYLVNDLSKDIENLSILQFEERVKYTKERLKLANEVRCSPKFAWNERNKQGQIQLRATINFMSESNLLGVAHNFAWTDIVGKRSQGAVDRVKRAVDDDLDFYNVKTMIETFDE